MALADWISESLKIMQQSNDGQRDDPAVAVYNEAIHYFVQVVTNECKEEGHLLQQIWTDHQLVYKRRVERMQRRVREKEEEAARVSCSLLTKVEERLKEYEGQFSKLKAETAAAHDENVELRTILARGRATQDRLQKQCTDLENSCTALRTQIEHLEEQSTVYKLMLEDTTGQNPSNSRGTSVGVKNDEAGVRLREQLLRLKLHNKARKSSQAVTLSPHPPGDEKSRKRGTLHLICPVKSALQVRYQDFTHQESPQDTAK